MQVKVSSAMKRIKQENPKKGMFLDAFHMCSQKNVCCDSQYSLKSMEETAVTWRELERAIECHQANSRTSICSYVKGETGGALPEHYKMTSSTLLVCMFPTKLSETDSLRVAWGAASFSKTCAHSTMQHIAARLAFVREHQNWQICKWCPVLFKDDSRFVLSPSDNCESVWRCYAIHLRVRYLEWVRTGHAAPKIENI